VTLGLGVRPGLGVTLGDGLLEPPGVAFGLAAVLAVGVAACDVVGDEDATGVGDVTLLA
jgi:hypothetical protein